MREREEFLNHQFELEQKRKNDEYIEKEKLKLLKEKYNLKRKEIENDFKEKMNQMAIDKKQKEIQEQLIHEKNLRIEEEKKNQLLKKDKEMINYLNKK